MKKVILLLVLLFLFCGCALLRDPIDNTWVFYGLGSIDYEHSVPIYFDELPIATSEYLIGTETVKLHREINTAEVIAELVAAGGIIVSILTLCI